MTAPVPVSVPASLTELLSPAWLTSALAARFGGINVTSVTPRPVTSRVSTNARFRIECAGGVPDGRDMELGYTVAPPVDCTPGYQGLPGGVCQCPHYGYVFTGRMRAVYPGTDWPDEIAEAGDVYFFPAGHSLIYDEPSEVLELNPAAALQALMNHFETMMSSGW